MSIFLGFKNPKNVLNLVYFGLSIFLGSEMS